MLCSIVCLCADRQAVVTQTTYSMLNDKKHKNTYQNNQSCAHMPVSPSSLPRAISTVIVIFAKSQPSLSLRRSPPPPRSPPSPPHSPPPPSQACRHRCAHLRRTHHSHTRQRRARHRRARHRHARHRRARHRRARRCSTHHPKLISSQQLLASFCRNIQLKYFEFLDRNFPDVMHGYSAAQLTDMVFSKTIDKKPLYKVHERSPSPVHLVFPATP